MGYQIALENQTNGREIVVPEGDPRIHPQTNWTEVYETEEDAYAEIARRAEVNRVAYEMGYGRGKYQGD